MKTLIVDDQYQDKAQVIASVLRRVGVANLELVTSAKDALRKMKAEKFDLLILDLQIPEEVGQDASPLGGKSLLEYVELNDTIYRPTSVLAITSHRESYDQCLDFFRQRGWTVMLGVDDEEYLYSVLSTQKAHLTARSSSFDAAIITALPHTELEAVLQLPCEWEKYQEPDDDNIYHVGSIRISNGETKSVIATCSPHMGMTAAAALTATVCLKFRPALIVMTGIAAGIKDRVELGDILIADPSWDWGSGKLTIKDNVPVFLSAPTQIPLDSSIRKKIQYLATNRTYLDEIYTEWRGGKRPPHDLRMHIGPVATGAVVLEDPETVALIKSQNRNTIGVEMEAYGVMSAAFYLGEWRPKVVAMKSVCDFADPEKGNEWQSYAAYTSAAMAFRFIRDHFFEQ